MRNSEKLASAKFGLLLIITLSLGLAGCDLSFMGDELGPGGTGSDGGGNNQGGNDGPVELTVNGDVGATGATNSFIIVTTANGATAWSGTSSNLSDYAATMTLMPSDFPLTSRASGGSDLVSGFSPDFDMRSTVMGSQDTVGNINPFSTLISTTAGYQGRGVNDSSIVVASQVILKTLNFGLDPSRVSNPITSPIQNGNVATFFRSNEALAEMIRRTTAALIIAGFSFTSDDVIAHLSGDLTDGVIDGRGIGSHARVAATSSIVSAQILLETMTNDLQVGGFDAENRIDSAISMTHPGATIMTRNLTAPAEMISQAALTVAAAYDLSPTSSLAALFDDVDSMPTGATVSTAEQVLPSNSPAIMDAPIAKVASGTAADHEVVNARMRTGLDPNAIDSTPPFISIIGSSQIALLVGDTYVEQGATATDDRDGDITSLIVIDNQDVNTSVAGDYRVTYNVSDSTGNAAVERIRNVSVSEPEVQDTVRPVITLVGPNPLNLVQGDSYVEPGATATDNVDGNLTSAISIDSSAVATSTVGDYPVRYNVSDAAGNAAVEVIRTVSVSAQQPSDTTPPVITLLGSNPVNLTEGDSYVEPGATAVDDVDGNISGSIVIDSSDVNTNTAGNYTVRYNVSDAAGNAANQVNRSVNVQAAPPPPPPPPPPPGGSGGSPWEAILGEAVGFGANVTGGKGKPLVTVTNLNNSGGGSLRQALADNPNGAWIRFSPGLTGTINLSTYLSPRRDTTIDGRGANITLHGGGTSVGRNVFRVIANGSNNLAFMYLKLRGASDQMRFGSYSGLDKSITVRGIWIHHVSFIGPSGDELIDFAPRVQDVTVSYSHFSNNTRGILIDRIQPPYTMARYAGVQPLKLTSHHNWFENISWRHPLCRHSMVHSYNTLHEGWGTGILQARSGDNSAGASVVVENAIADAAGASNNIFAESKDTPSEPPGTPLNSIGTHILKNGARVIEKNPGSAFNPRSFYSYTAETANGALESKIRNNAGWQNVSFPQ